MSADHVGGRADMRLITILPVLASLSVLAAAPTRAAETPEVPALLRLGVVSAVNGRVAGLPATDRLEPFRRRLAAALQKPVVLAPQPDGRALVAALVAGRLDYALLSASGFAAAERACHCLEPLAAPRAADGATGWRATVVVRGDSTLRDVADLKGKSLAAPGSDAFSGRAYAFAALAKAGAAEADLGRVDPASGPEAAARAVAERRADAALIWLPDAGAGASAATAPRGPLALLAEHGGLPPDGLRPLWQSPSVPHGPHAVRADLPSAWRVRLRDLLVNLKSDDPDAYDAVEPDLGGGFVVIDKAAYTPLGEALPAR
jgi:phosphonate transport system substrate-binding protein